MEWKKRNPIQIADVAVRDGITFIKLKNKWWSIIPHPGFAGLSGCVFGYNFYAVNASDALVQLGFWTQEDANDFWDRYHTESNRQRAESEITHATEVLSKYGYDVTKKTTK